MAFVNATAWISHHEDHHPDLEVGYNKCQSALQHAFRCGLECEGFELRERSSGNEDLIPQHVRAMDSRRGLMPTLHTSSDTESTLIQLDEPEGTG